VLCSRKPWRYDDGVLLSSGCVLLAFFAVDEGSEGVGLKMAAEVEFESTRSSGEPSKRGWLVVVADSVSRLMVSPKRTTWES